MEEIKQKLKNHLADNKISDVLHSLEQLTQSNPIVHHQVIALKRQFETLEQKNKQGILSPKNARREEREIAHQALELIHTVGQKKATSNSLRSSTLLPTSTLWGLTIGILIIIMMPLVLFFPCPADSQYFFFRVLFSFIVALLGLIIPQLFQFKRRLFISAIAFPLIFSTVYYFCPGVLYNPATCQQEHFDYTFFVEDEQGTALQLKHGALVLSVGKDRTLVKIDSTGAATFKQLPTHYKNDRIKIELQNVDNWQFKNNQDSQYISLKETSHHLVLHPIGTQ